MHPKIEHTLIGLGLLMVVVVAIVVSCTNSPLLTDNSNNPPGEDTGNGENTGNNDNGTGVTCASVPVYDKGAVYRVPVEGGADPTKLVDQLNMPWNVLVDENNNMLYFAEDGTGGCTGSVKRLRADAPPGTAPEVVVSGLDRVGMPVIHDGFLYFAEFSMKNGSVHRVNLDTGEKTVLVTGLQRPFSVAVDSKGEDRWVYLTELGDGTDGTVKRFRVGSDGSVTGTETLAQNLGMPIGLVIDHSYAYVVEMNGGMRVFRMKRDFEGTMPTQQDLMIGLSTPYPPVLEDPTPDNPDDGNSILYVADFNVAEPEAGKVYKLSGVDADPVDADPIVAVTPDDCGEEAALSCALLAKSLYWPMLVAIDDQNVYWTEVYWASVKGVPKSGNPAAPISLANGTDHGLKKPLGIATDGVNVYFTDLGENPCCFD